MSEGRSAGKGAAEGILAESGVVCHRYQRALGRRTTGKWTLKEETPKYAPDRTCDVEHLKIELEVDLPAERVKAVCTQRLRPAYGPFQSITLDAVNLDVRSVRDGTGRALEYTYLDQKLTVRFPRKVTGEAELVISYLVDHPALGLYFFGPSEVEPKATWQLWSQGEDEEARHWIPCHDAPNEKMTTEMIVTVDSRYTAISNGALLSVTPRKGGKQTYHYLESIPHVSYLITLVVGEFTKVSDRWRGIPVDYYVEPGREKEGRRSFGKTPRMMEFFSKQLDYPYPYEKYAQVAIRHFHFGGMENTSATSQTDGTLHDERAALDFSSDELVAHELAHQWFGDLLTCKSWAHAWLNEGFATYFEALWKEEDEGRDEFDYEMIQNALSYMAEPYRRPIVTNRYAYPHDLFDMHLYPKGGWVLHMLRRKIGDELFWKAMRLYVRRHEKGCVETIDLIRACEDASGMNLTGFFDQWVMSPGHPDLEGAISWEQESKRVKVTLKQTQKIEGGAPVFRIPVRVECALGGGKIVAESFEMDHPEQTFYVACPQEPATVVLDPEQCVLATWKVARPIEWLEAALLGPRRHPRVAARVDAVQQIANKPSYPGETVLGSVLLGDRFWGVQAAAAQALAKIRTPHALNLLVAGLKVKHPKARRAVAQALGAYRGPEAAAALRRVLAKGDASYFVEASAAAALGRTAQPGIVADLRKAMKKPSWHDIIATHSADGLAATRDESVVDDLLALATDRRRYWNCRLTAMRALAGLGSARPLVGPRVAEELSRYLEDPDYLIASRVSDAIVSLGREEGLAALRRAASSTPDPRLAHHYLLAADELASQRRRSEDVDRLREELEKLRSETKEMREELQKIAPRDGKGRARAKRGRR